MGSYNDATVDREEGKGGKCSFKAGLYVRNVYSGVKGWTSCRLIGRNEKKALWGQRSEPSISSKSELT